MTYTLHWDYTGNIAMTNGSVRDVLPLGFTMDTAASTLNNGVLQSTASATGYAIFNLPALPVGSSSGDIMIVGTVTGASGTLIINTAKVGTVSGTSITYTGETDTTDNTDTAVVTLVSPPVVPVLPINYDLSITKTINTGVTAPGGTLIYTIAYYNAGPTRSNITVVDML